MRSISLTSCHISHRTVVPAAVLLLCLAAVTATAQSPTQGAAAFDARVELVTLSVSVLDDNGAPIADLTPDDFIIFEDGTLREAALVLAPDQTPLDITLLVDLSSSMRNADWRDRARDFSGSAVVR